MWASRLWSLAVLLLAVAALSQLLPVLLQVLLLLLLVCADLLALLLPLLLMLWPLLLAGAVVCGSWPLTKNAAGLVSVWKLTCTMCLYVLPLAPRCCQKPSKCRAAGLTAGGIEQEEEPVATADLDADGSAAVPPGPAERPDV